MGKRNEVGKCDYECYIVENRGEQIKKILGDSNSTFILPNSATGLPHWDLQCDDHREKSTVGHRLLVWYVAKMSYLVTNCGSVSIDMGSCTQVVSSNVNIGK